MTDAFEDLVSHLDYPMFIVTTADGDELAGCLVGFVTQASIDPPRLLVLLSKRNHTYRVAQGATVLTVHLLNADNHDLAARFGGQTEDDTGKFPECEWTAGPDGVPLLAGVRGWIAGRIIARTDCGDHVAHLLERIDAASDRQGEPLTFQMVRDIEPGHDP